MQVVEKKLMLSIEEFTYREAKPNFLDVQD